MKKLLARSLSVLVAISVIGSTSVFAVEKRTVSKGVTPQDMVDVYNACGNDTAKSFDEIERLVHIDETDVIDETIDATVKWNENSAPIYRENIKDMFGVQYETNRGWDNIITEDGVLKDDYVEKIQTMFDQPVVRWGGGSSNGYDMMDMIAPIDQRKPSVNLFDPTRSNSATDLHFGPIEFIKAHQANNPDVAFLWCLSLDHSTAEHNAQFIHFLLDDKDESEWGALRASYGIENPVKIWGIELGNEMYFTTEKTDEEAKAETDEYIRLFREHAEAINAVDPEIRCIPCLNGNSSRAGFYEWNRPIISQLGSKYKYMAFHLYYGGYEYAYNGHWIDDALRICRDYFGKDHGIQLCLSEHAKWDTKTAFSRMGLGSALCTSQFLNIMLQRTNMCMTAYHCGSTRPSFDTKWAFFSKMGDDTLAFSALPYLYKIYTENIGDRVLTTSVSAPDTLLYNEAGKGNIYTDESSTRRMFTAVATPKGKHQMVVFLTNRLPYVDFNVTFNTKLNYTLKKEIVFTSPNIASFAPSAKDEKDVFKVTETEKNIKDFKTYHMPNKSFVCLILETEDEIEAAEDERMITPKFTGEDKFSDIDGLWSKNEINLLADAGAISGVGDGLYNPNAQISVAELASMVVKSLNYGTYDKKQIFDNITPDQWYYNAINTLGSKGYLKAEEVADPEAPATVKLAAMIAYRIAGKPDIKNLTTYQEKYPWITGLDTLTAKAIANGIKCGVLTKLFTEVEATESTALSRADAAGLVYRITIPDVFIC